MSLLPAFEDFEATATWVSSTASQQQKFADNDYTASATPSHPVGDHVFEALFGIRFGSSPPQLPEAPVFDTDLSSLPAPPSAAVQAVVSSANGHSVSSVHSNPSTASRSTDQSVNALQLDMLEAITPAGSPRAVSSGYTSPSFQFSPTPTLTMCPTVDSTPAPRSNSRCSSRSSFSVQTEDFKPCISGIAATTVPADVKPVIGPDGKPKKQHLCPYEECPRHLRTFRSNADLQRHIRSHRGERPYACPSPGCSKAYGQQNKMVNHVKQQHPSLLSSIEVGRSRRRTAVSAPVSRAPSMSRASSVTHTVSAASTPGGTPLRVPIRPPITGHASNIGPTRGSINGTARAAPYSLPSSMTSGTAAGHLGLPGVSSLSQGLSSSSDSAFTAQIAMQLRQDVFGISQSSLWR